MRLHLICCSLFSVALGFLLLAGSGCALFQPDLQPANQAARDLLPEAYSVSETTGTPAMTWWQDFGSADLDRWVGLALTQNFSVVQAEARMRQAQALAEQAGAALMPELSLTGEAVRTRQHREGVAPEAGGGTTDTDRYALGGVAASYEVDLWGRVRSGKVAALRGYQASRSDLETAWMTISAQIAEQWLLLQASRTKLDLLRKQLETNRTLVELLELRNRSGQATALDVYQQRQAAAATESAIPPLEAAIVVVTNQLNVLMGQPYGAPLESLSAGLPELPPLPAAGLPSDLLTQRPDIQAALLRLEVAGWSLASAKANRLPALRLSGSAMYQSDEFADLFDNWLANLAAGLTAPIFDGGRRRAEVRRSEAVRDERLSVYKETVLRAITEVENALIRENRQRAYLESLRRETGFARKALDEAQQRYRNGSIDYLNVLAALTSVQRLEQTEIDARQGLLRERIGLVRALGGRWTHMPLDETEKTP